MGDISIKGRSPILRQGYAAGGAVKGGAKVAKKILDFVKTGKYIDKHGTKINVPKVVKRLKKQGSPHLETYEESMKAEGGRIGKAVGGGLTRRTWGVDPREQIGGSPKGKPHSTREGRIAAGSRRLQRMRQKALNEMHDEAWGGSEKGKPHSTREGRIASGRRNFKRFLQKRVGAKKGGSDKNWIQKATASIKKRGTKGKCTPITKKGCTGRAKALAKTFKKMAKKRKAA